jgi:Holliday junction resolvasome RuvABC DNA-binding subunit
MKVGIIILLGPLKFYFGTPRRRLSLGRGRQAGRKIPAKELATSHEAIIAPARATARDTVSTSTPALLDPQLRQDSIDALVLLGFRRKQATSRVDAITGATAEAIIKSALQRGGCS